jgi:hypothetical protein
MPLPGAAPHIPKSCGLTGILSTITIVPRTRHMSKVREAWAMPPRQRNVRPLQRQLAWRVVV